MAGAEKKAAEEGRTIVFIDESGVYLLPIVVRTYAPCGQTPILRAFLSYNHLSLIGAITPQGQLFLTVYDHSITSKEVVAFLEQLQRMIPGLLLVIWDGCRLTDPSNSKPIWPQGRPNGSTWSNCPDMHRTSNPWNGFGVT